MFDQKEYMRQYREKNRDKINENSIKYYYKHRESNLLKGKKYRENNKEKIKSKNIRYRKENTEQIKIRVKNKIRQAKMEMIEAYGGVCICCGERNYEFLTIDHINGGGKVDRKNIGVGCRFYRFLKKQGWPKNGYRLLCMNCNLSYGLYGYCPHKKDLDGVISNEQLY